RIFPELNLLFAATACDSDLGSQLFLSPSDWHNARVVQANPGDRDSFCVRTTSTIHSQIALHIIIFDVSLSPRRTIVNYSAHPPNWYLDSPVWTGLGCTPRESVARFPRHQRN